MNFNPFSVRGCWGQQMLLFWKLVDETQMVKPPEPTNYHDSKKYLILLPLRAIYFRSFHYETPCTIQNYVQAFSWQLIIWNLFTYSFQGIKVLWATESASCSLRIMNIFKIFLPTSGVHNMSTRGCVNPKVQILKSKLY